jgi:hypothetical protein
LHRFISRFRAILFFSASSDLMMTRR